MKKLLESRVARSRITCLLGLMVALSFAIMTVMSSFASCADCAGVQIDDQSWQSEVFLAASYTGSEVSYPLPIGNINDYVGVLSDADTELLEGLVDAVLSQTGVTFAVAIVESHGEESLEEYAVNLYERWEIGQRGEDMGLLVLLSMEEREVRMEVGYGLEPVITDGIAGECLDIMVKYFQDGEYGSGLYEGLLHAAQYIAESQGISLDLSTKYEEPVPTVFLRRTALGVVGALVLVFALFAYSMNRKRHCPRCRSKLVYTDKVVQKATHEAPGLAVKIVKCPVCGYQKESTYRINPLGPSAGVGGSLPPLTRGRTGSGGLFRGAGGSRSGGSSAGRSSGPKGFGGGRSGGGGASRKW